MSDPVTKIEIEDVLSSIRRLVSEDSRKGGPAAVRAEPRKPDKLVLTPSLRVGEAEEDTAASDRPEFDPEAPWTDPEATLYEAAQAFGDEEDASDQELASETQPMMLRPEDAVADTGASGADVEVVSPETSVEAQADLETLSARFEALEAAISKAEDAEWEPDGSDEDVYSGSIEEIAWEDHDPYSDEGLAVPEFEDDMPEETGEPSAEADPLDEEPDHAEDDAADEDREGLFSLDETIMDEEMLRELVADIVRQELQG
ncbi:hypothetical protein AB9K41_07495, partial [Cribrihabitans sp. XS_ASV171]